jgi:hypothetical protein
VAADVACEVLTAHRGSYEVYVGVSSSSEVLF